MIAGAQVSAQVLASAKEMHRGARQGRSEAKGKRRKRKTYRVAKAKGERVARKYLDRDVRLPDEFPRLRAAVRASRSPKGTKPTDDERVADVFVINTCSVRERAQDKLYTRLGEIREVTAGRSGRPLVAVTGCVAQQEGHALLRRDAGIDVVAGTQSLRASAVAARWPRGAPGRRGSMSIRTTTSRFRWEWPSIRIRSGPGSRSSRAATSSARSASCPTRAVTSACARPPTSSAEVEEAARTGHREVQLLGQIVNHYQAPDDPRCDFAELLARVSTVPGIDRIRFASPHPRHVTERLIAAIRDLPKVCKHLHLPVQSGSDRHASADAPAVHAAGVSGPRRSPARRQFRASRSPPT